MSYVLSMWMLILSMMKERTQGELHDTEPGLQSLMKEGESDHRDC